MKQKIVMNTTKAAAILVFAVVFAFNIKANLENELTLDVKSALAAGTAGGTGGTAGGTGGSSGTGGVSDKLWMKEPKISGASGCPKVTVSGTRWVGVSGQVAVGTVIKPGTTVTVNAQGEKGYTETYWYQTDGQGTLIECPNWNVYRTCTPGKYCPGTGPGPYSGT